MKFIDRIQSWALSNSKPVITTGFSLENNNSAKTVPRKYIVYRPPKIVKGKRWYVEYSYKVPVELKDKYKGPWERFRVFEDINRYKDNAYAETLRSVVEYALDNGYNPFEEELSMVKKPDLKASEWSLNITLNKFMDACKEDGLRPKTLQSYGIVINFMKDYFQRDNKIFQPLTSIAKQDILDFMAHYKRLQNWNNNTYNNYLGYISRIFNWAIQEDRLDKTPVKGIKEKKSPITRHKIYDDKTAEKLKDMISRNDPYLFSFVEFIYYTATRPKSEARLLQVKHLLFDRDLIQIPGDIAKNKTGSFIPMPEELKKKLIHLKELPPDTYIWGIRGPGKKPASQNHFANLYKPYKDKLGLGPDASIYSWKHTRCIDLVKAKADPYDIMRLFRHSSLEQTMKYMRDLGLTDFSAVLKKGKKF